MRNLIPVHRAAIRTGDQCPSKLATVAITDEGNPLFIFTNGQDGDQVDIFEKVGHEWNWWPSWAGDEIKGVLPGDPTIFALKNGNIVEATSEGAQIVGGFDTEILAASWAPDGEVGVLVTDSKVIFLGRSLDLISEHPFDEQDLSLSKHVSVGWGKKETQFQGRGARAARDPTMPEHVDTGVLAEADEGQVEISWRGDGEFVAVSSSESGRRTIRVFTREGIISSISEPLDNLSPLVAWRPSGATIASVRGNELVFFERNGLKRNSFFLSHQGEVTGLAWSFDSEILAVMYSDRVELWTTKNYHWYRKQVLLSGTGQQATSWMSWHPEKRTLLVCWGQVVETYSFAVGMFTGGTGCLGDDGTVAVIDGNKIKITPLANCNFPPPMSKFSVPVQDPIHAAISETRELAVATATGVWYKDEFTSLEGARQVAFCGTELVTLSDEHGKGVLRYRGHEHRANIYMVKNGHYQTTDGSVYDMQHNLVAKFDKPCDFVVSAKAAFGLTEEGTLYAYEHKCTVLARNITSMHLTPDYLLVTTPTLLKFIHLDLELSVPEDTADTEQIREIERGSLLVTVVPAKMSVTLQAPRGNLETIYPRMLVVGQVRKLLDAADFVGAFASCRIHRIDLQFLYDYNPKFFEANLGKFLEIGEANIDLFLAALKPENVAQTKYRETRRQAEEAEQPKDVNAICDLLASRLRSSRNIVTSHAYRIPPDLRGALQACKGTEDVQHLVFLTDADLLYETALGMYDLQLTLTVAQQSQKDPKEYLPFLRARDKENEFRRRYEIDEVLKNRESAVRNLVQDPEATDDELLEYLERYELHEVVLPLVEGAREMATLKSYAYYLQSKSRYQEAGLQFEFLGELDEALEAYIRCGDWRRALSLDASKAQDLADACLALKMYGDAAQIYAHHLKQNEQAVECYCRAFQFDDAILLYKDSPKIDEGLREQFGIVQELLADCRSQIPSQLRRLRDLREKREQSQSYTVDQLGDDVDTMSIAGTETTNASFVTRYTDKTGGTAQTGASRRTQKNKRREERKRARGKKGTVYEEEYLISSMGRLIERVEVTRPDAKRLVDGLVRRQMRAYAVQIFESYAAVCGLIKDHVVEFYTVAQADLERYDQDGNKFYADAPVAPALPGPL